MFRYTTPSQEHTVDAFRTELYPAIRYHKGFFDKLFKRKRLRFPPIGTVESGPGAKLVVTLNEESTELDLADGFRLQLGRSQGTSAEGLSLRLRPSSAGPLDRSELGFRVALPHGTLAELNLPEHEPRLPCMTTQAFAVWWAWLSEIAEPCGVQLPPLKVPSDPELCLPTPGALHSCISCTSLNVLVGEEGFRCLDCGYESDGIVQARRERELEARVAQMTDEERWQRVVALLENARTEMDAYLPDLERSKSGDNDNPDSRSSGIAALTAFQRAANDIQRAKAFAPKPHLIDPAVNAMSFAQQANYSSVTTWQVKSAIKVIDGALVALMKRAEEP